MKLTIEARSVSERYAAVLHLGSGIELSSLNFEPPETYSTVWAALTSAAMIAESWCASEAWKHAAFLAQPPAVSKEPPVLVKRYTSAGIKIEPDEPYGTVID